MKSLSTKVVIEEISEGKSLLRDWLVIRAFSWCDWDGKGTACDTESLPFRVFKKSWGYLRSSLKVMSSDEGRMSEI